MTRFFVSKEEERKSLCWLGFKAQGREDNRGRCKSRKERKSTKMVRGQMTITNSPAGFYCSYLFPDFQGRDQDFIVVTLYSFQGKEIVGEKRILRAYLFSLNVDSIFFKGKME